MFTCGGDYSAAKTDVPRRVIGGPSHPGPQRTLAHSQSKKHHKGQRKGVLRDLQGKAVSGPDASPHPLHVAEQHDDAEEGEVAGDTYEGAGHGEVV